MTEYIHEAMNRKTLADHQLRILREMNARSSLAIFAEMGTGKTIIALTWIRDALTDGRIDDALIVCPASIVDNWRFAIESVTEFNHMTPLDAELLKEYVMVISLQSIWQRSTRTVRHRDGRTSQKKEYHVRDSVNKDWGAIIIDESHGLGDKSSLQTRHCLKLAHKATYRYIMTGTPDNGKYNKLYGQFKFLDPTRWTSFKEFAEEYIRTYDQYGNPRSYYTDKCESLKREYGVVARLRDCYDMPTSTETDLPCTVDGKPYYDMTVGNVVPYNVSVTASGTLYIKKLQVCSGFLKTDDGITRVKTDKVNALLTLIEGRDDKVVVFCNYIDSIDRICETLAKHGIPHHRFDGSTKEPTWQQFQQDDSRVFVAQYQRGGVGIDLFASNCMVFYEPTNRAVLLEQAKARIMRKGQTRHCSYYYLYCRDTIEERAMRSVREGVDVSREMLDTWNEEENRRIRKTG